VRELEADAIAIEYESLMSQALQLAERGRGYTRSNPLVGAVVVDRTGQVISSGHHERLGAPHAEVIALNRAGARAQSATLIVNLEPCCHTGRTGPCTAAIVAAGISRVVIAMRDPDPRVNGEGVEMLRAAGVEVVENIGTRAAMQLNEHYLTLKATGRPFVTLKLALTLDGNIADKAGASQWITGPVSRRHAHALRARHDAIVVGAGTARRDNPSLTVRDADGPNPRRFVLLGDNDIDADLNLFDDSDPAVRVGTEHVNADWTVPATPGGLPSLHEFVRQLAENDYASLLVEGGARVAGAFVDARLVDKFVLYYGPVLLGSGRPALDGWQRSLPDALRLKNVTVETLADGYVVNGYPEWS